MFFFLSCQCHSDTQLCASAPNFLNDTYTPKQHNSRNTCQCWWLQLCPHSCPQTTLLK